MSHQKRQQLNKMESWLSGRRRTIGNRVGVMSVSRVQIPNSPPKVSWNRKVSALFALPVAKLQFRRQGGTDRRPFQSRTKVPMQELSPSGSEKTEIHAPGFFGLQSNPIEYALTRGLRTDFNILWLWTGDVFLFPGKYFFGVDHLWSIFYPFRR